MRLSFPLFSHETRIVTWTDVKEMSPVANWWPIQNSSRGNHSHRPSWPGERCLREYSKPAYFLSSVNEQCHKAGGMPVNEHRRVVIPRERPPFQERKHSFFTAARLEAVRPVSNWRYWRVWFALAPLNSVSTWHSSQFGSRSSNVLLRGAARGVHAWFFFVCGGMFG